MVKVKKIKPNEHWVGFVLLMFVVSRLMQAMATSDCQEVAPPVGSELAYYGWPYHVSCKIIPDSKDLPIDDFSDVQCLIKDKVGEVIFNGTTTPFLLKYSRDSIGYSVSKITANTPLNYTVTLLKPLTNLCFIKASIHVNVSFLPAQSCEDFLRKSNRPTIPTAYESPKVLECGVPRNEYPKITSSENVTYQWVHNCKNTVSNQQMHILHLDSTEDAGSYVCKATLNGMTRYLMVHRYCVYKELSIDTIPSLSCQSLDIKANPGEEARFACQTNFGEGRVTKKNIAVKWKKSNNGSEYQTCRAQSNTTRSNSPICYYEHPHSQCYEHAPTEEEIDNNAVIPIFFTIKISGEDDYGSYEILVIKDNEQSVNRILTISPNPIPALLSQAAVAGICVGVLFISFIFMLFIVWNSVYIRVYYKRYFGVYIIDNRKYGATFAYNFSHEIDSFSQQDLKSSVKFVREGLEELGYKVYDEKRDGSYGMENSENILNSVKNSHRLLIFLTLDFIKDGWSVLTLQKGFEEMINSQSKLIFVLLPGIKEYLKQHSKDDDSFALIQRAIKLNYAIHWNNKKLNKDYFSLMLEDAMPKLFSQSGHDDSSVFSLSKFSEKKTMDVQYDTCLRIETNVV